MQSPGALRRLLPGCMALQWQGDRHGPNLKKLWTGVDYTEATSTRTAAFLAPCAMEVC